MQIFSGASEQAGRISRLTWFMIALSAAIYIIVVGALALALMRNRRRNASAVELTARSLTPVVVAGIALPAIVLGAVFAVAETVLGRSPDPRPAITVWVVGHQWWWEVRYAFADSASRVVTANEIHIPVGRPVRLLVTSADVIHSFWVPRLQGKIDVIPGDTNELHLQARTAGTYRGACEEFCGMQHANMGIVVVAEDDNSFNRWIAREQTTAVAPTDSTLAAGQRLVTTGTCAGCHTIRGTPAAGQVGPDLTHIGSRSTIAAVTLPNSLGNLAGWIANAQAIKPGVVMPVTTQLTGAQLRAVAAYVASLR
jgi:cytochrome c oxidase subunit 2